ncbi:hypothetical protein Tco_1262298 [Tanacetum coccineum]
MTTLNFADTHNLVAFLSKPAKSEGFEQIVDFLNVKPIKYALTINPTIYTSCIEQFWATVKAKTINGEVQLQALVDRKKIIITESIVRRDLQLEDVEGVDCLPNATIFEQITLMGQLEGMETHDEIYIAPSHTKKIFRNMRRVGKGEGSAIPTDLYLTPIIIQPSSSQPQKKQQPRRSKKKDTQIPQSSVLSDFVADEAVNEEIDDSLERATTTSTSLDAEQDRGNITKTQFKATSNEPSSLRTSSGGGPRRQETMRDIIAQTRSENVSKLFNDPLLASGNTLRSDNEIAKLKRRVKKLEKKKRPRTHVLKRLRKVGAIARVESSEEEILDMFGVNDLDGDEVVVVEQEVVAKDLTVDEVTLAQALAALKSAKPNVKANVVEEPKSIVVGIVSTLLALGLPEFPELAPKGGGICGIAPDMIGS